MKKLSLLIATVLMVCAMLVACGGGAQPSGTAATAAPTAAPAAAAAPPVVTPAPAAQAGTGDAAPSAEEYVAAMNEFVTAFDPVTTTLGQMVAQAETLSTEEEFVEWCQQFMELKTNVGLAADELVKIAEYAPEEYQESHAKVTVAVAAVYDGMTGYEDAVDAVINGDASAFEDGLAEFIGNIVVAEELWAEAVR